MTRCDQRATGARYGSSSGKAEPCQGGESRGERPTYPSYPTLEAEEEKGVRGRRGKTSRADVWRMKNSVTEHRRLLKRSCWVGGAEGSKCSRLPTYGMSTAHGDLRGRAGGRANAGSVVGSTAGRARGSRHRASRRRARRGVRNSYRDGARTRTASAAKVSFAEFSKKRGHTHRILSGFSSLEN